MVSFSDIVRKVREKMLTVDQAVELIRGEDRLSKEQLARVDEVVARCRESGQTESLVAESGDEFYAYPHAGGGVAWGVNGAAAHGFCIARGVRE